MAIRTGDAADGFELPEAPGQMVDVGADIGSRPVVLLFFPLAYSPTCTDELCTMRDDWDAWSALDAAVYGICIDSPFITAKFREELSIPFPILSDFNADVSRRYGALYDEFFGMRNVTKRAAFVIGADGTVRYDWVSEDAGKLPDFDAIKASLATAQTA